MYRIPSVYDGNIAASRELDGTYDTVKKVAENLDKITAVNTAIDSGLLDDMENVVVVAENLPTIDGVSQNLPFLHTLADSGLTDLITDVSTLTTDMTGKVDNSRVLTDVIANAVFTDTVYDDTPVTDLIANTSNPHSVTSAQVGLGNVDNTSDVDKPISTATVTEFSTKQDNLVNQINIRSINGETLLGAGDLVVSAGSGGYAANVYLTGIASTTVGSYSQLSYTPESTGSVVSVVVNNNEVLLEDYIFDGDVLADILPAGEWGFQFSRKTSNTGGTTVIRFEVFSRESNGTETTLFSTLSKSIEDTGYAGESVLTTQGLFNINETDRIGVRVYAATTKTSNVTVSLQVGGNSATYVTTPLEIRHSQLRARDDDNAHPINAISGLSTTLTGIATDISGLGTSITGLGTDIAAIQTDLIEIKEW